MATTEYGVNAINILSDVPSEKANVGEQGGGVKVIYDSFTSTGAIAVSSILYMGGKIPAGARVLDVKIVSTDLGTTGDLDVGWAASADGVEAASADGFFADIDVNAAAASYSMFEDNGAAAGMGKKFTASVQPVISFPEATTAAGTIKMIIEYILD
jgi:hypothetical protein